MKNYLLITLGHNSSAIYVDNSQFEETKKSCIIGYEEERLSRIKADSQFPIDAINEIIYNVGLANMKGCKILISHWFNFTGAEIPNKYITSQDINFLLSISSDIQYVNEKFTHHDAHAWSAYEFRDFFKKQDGNIPIYCIVADGFGNNEEVLSIYRRDNGKKPELVDRFYGYRNSLGLFYQYATSFVGMKENQDEYKFLGYEAHIDEAFGEEAISYIAAQSDNIVERFKTMYSSEISKTMPNINASQLINMEHLTKTKKFWYNSFADVLNGLGYSEKEFTSFEARVAIAFVIQRTVEKVITFIAASYGMQHICLAGGLFYNVKLNNKVLKYVQQIGGTVSIMPLAGDQGAAIGMYAAQEDTPQYPFETLAIGTRRLYNIEKYESQNIHIKQVPKAEEAKRMLALEIAYNISQNRIVNVIYGNMEFGPRALCNTSSLFLPSTKLTAENNANNLRNEVMPCAPVCREVHVPRLFSAEEANCVIGSTRFMICTLHYDGRSYSKLYGGVMHKETLVDNSYTGRPQVVRDGTFMEEVLKYVQIHTDMKCLVNTSFNCHGNPIVFDTADIISNYKAQCERAKRNGTEEPILYIIKY